MFNILVGCIITSIISLSITPLIKKLSYKIGAVDVPNKRRVNTKIMPSAGGLSIFITFFFSVFFIQRINTTLFLPILVASTVIVVLGVIDDIKEISPKFKVLGILVSSLIIYFWAGIGMHSITIPFFGIVELGLLSLPMTILWIVGLTNAMNLIDGLDGLAAGVSMIGLTSMGIIGFFFLTIEEIAVPLMIFTLVAAILGFFPYNFFPASIYLGDTGSLLLGFLISTFSLYSLKNVTFISVVIPVVILGIPITDTFYAIIRRVVNKRPISQPDKNHMHHQLMNLGLSHRQTVLIIYCVAIIFSVIALLYPISTFLGSILITIAVLVGLELFVEIIGLVGKRKQPLISRLRKLFRK